MFLNGKEITTPGPTARTIEDDSFLMLFNAHDEDRSFMLPRRRFGAQWALELSTADPTRRPGSAATAPARSRVTARSLVILQAGAVAT